MHPGLVLFLVSLLAGSVFAGMLLGLGCTEGDIPRDTAWSEVCDTYRAWDSAAWWSAVFAPVVLLMGTQLLPWFRRHAVVAAAAVVVVTAAFWTTLLLIVTGNLLAE
jgi:hypothetical protein